MGKEIKCPKCSTRFTVTAPATQPKPEAISEPPSETTVEAITPPPLPAFNEIPEDWQAAMLSKAPIAKPAPAKPSIEFITHKCDRCRYTITAPASRAGMEEQCPLCNFPNVYPTLAEYQARLADPEAHQKEYIVFQCHSCKTWQKEESSKRGRLKQCNSCGGYNKVFSLDYDIESTIELIEEGASPESKRDASDAAFLRSFQSLIKSNEAVLKSNETIISWLRSIFNLILILFVGCPIAATVLYIILGIFAAAKGNYVN
ncbi:hypothetical protein [Singulisphaera sp. PoT]|uniref:hypothetical protein n=1 Tax=Singulisphaera sp. PoT TaxID=3411797 RepID=UPI003BF5D0BD